MINLENLFNECLNDCAILIFLSHKDLYNKNKSALEKFEISFLENKSKKVLVREHEMILNSIPSRELPNKYKLMDKLGKLNTNKMIYYEVPDKNSDYLSYIYIHDKKLTETEKKIYKKATIYKFEEINIKSKFIEIKLHSQNGLARDFCITPNIAPLCDKEHFIVYAAPFENNKALKQKYFPGKTLWWMDDLSEKIQNCNYRMFFNHYNNSMDTYHIQVINISFPVFNSLEQKYPGKLGQIPLKENDWVIDDGTLYRYTEETKNDMLAMLDNEIGSWINSNHDNTFNLIYQKRSDNIKEFLFLRRKKKFNYYKPNGVKNKITIAGLEAAGVLLCNEEDFYVFPDKCNKWEIIE